jgi:hypothetical protein
VRNVFMVTAGLVAATAVMLRQLVLAATHAIPGELRDPLLNTWILAWDAARLRDGLRGVWDAPILYPYHSTLAFSEHLFGIAIFAAPFEWITGNPVLAYNVMFFASFVFAGVSMFLLARELTGRTDAAIVAAAIFAFHPYRHAQVAHLQLLVNGWMPLTLLGLHRYFATGSRTALAAATIAYWFLAMSNGYYLFFFGVVLAGIVAWGLWHAERPARSRMARDIVVAVVLLGAAYAPIAREYLHVRQQYDLSRVPDEVASFGADVGSYLTMPDAVRAHLRITLPSYPKPAGPEERHDGMLFPGFTMVALAAVALARSRTRRVTRLYAAIAAMAFVLSLGPEPTIWGHRLMPSGPYAWLDAIIPVLDALRVPARFASIVYLALTVLAAIGAASLLERRRPRAAAIATVIVALFACFEGYGEIPLAEVGPRGRTRDYGLYGWLRDQPAGAVAELPIGRLDGGYRSFIYQYNTLVHRHPIVNGWTGYSTALQQFLGSPASPFRDPDRVGDAVDLLRGLRVRYLIVHPDDFEPRENAAPIFDALVAQSRAFEAVRRFGPVVAFVLSPAPPPGKVRPFERVDPSTIHVKTMQAADRLPLLFDDNADTRWTTGSAQDGSEWIELRFDRVIDVRRLRFEVHPRSFSDYPRALAIDALDEADGATHATPLFRGSTLMAFGRGLLVDPMRVPVDIALPWHPTRAIRIAQTGRALGIWWWSIDELSVWWSDVDR